jgi:heat-inducible transcriptional repressor
MEIMSSIGDYDSEMLTRVIDLYISTGKPVSSRKLREMYNLNVSTAKIRMILHHLEESGLLYKPHISSGRMPTDLGYRVYVNEIKGENYISRRFIEMIATKIRKDWFDVREVMTRTSRLLSDLTNYMGLVMGKFTPSLIVEGIKIYRKESNRGIVVIKLKKMEKKVIHIEFARRYPARVIDYAVQMVNENVVGYPMEEAVDRLRFLTGHRVGDESEITKIISREMDQLFSSSIDLMYHFENNPDQIATLELNEPKALKNLVRIMGERTLLIDLMMRRMKEELMVTIGSENELKEFENFSIVTKKFTTPVGEGLLGVLGPTRMSYGMVMELLRCFAEQLTLFEPR